MEGTRFTSFLVTSMYIQDLAPSKQASKGKFLVLGMSHHFSEVTTTGHDRLTSINKDLLAAFCLLCFCREINEALRPGIYSLIDICTASDIQRLHTVLDG